VNLNLEFNWLIEHGLMVPQRNRTSKACMFVGVSICLSYLSESLIYFKELPHLIVQAGKFKSADAFKSWCCSLSLKIV
jgi:hypothetical protein